MPRTELTPAEVLRIRQLWDTGRYTARGIAQVYGCAAETVARIGRRETWAWLSEQGEAELSSADPADRRSGKDSPAASTASHSASEAAASLDRLMAELEQQPPTTTPDKEPPK